MPRERLPVRTYGMRGVLRRRLVRDVKQRIEIGRQPFLLRSDNGYVRDRMRRGGTHFVRRVIGRSVSIVHRYGALRFHAHRRIRGRCSGSRRIRDRLRYSVRILLKGKRRRICPRAHPMCGSSVIKCHTRARTEDEQCQMYIVHPRQRGAKRDQPRDKPDTEKCRENDGGKPDLHHCAASLLFPSISTPRFLCRIHRTGILGLFRHE